MFEGTIEELKQMRSGNINVNIVSSDASSVVGSLNGQYQTSINDQNSVEVYIEDREMIPKIISKLINDGIKLYEVNTHKEDLEQLFINLTTSK